MHFLGFSFVVATTTTNAIAPHSPMVSVASTMLVCVTPPALVTRVRRPSVFTWVCLVVFVYPLIEVGTSLLPTLVDS
jgi:hypothetical protein